MRTEPAADARVCAVAVGVWHRQQRELANQKPRQVKFLQRGGGKNAMTERLRVEKEKVCPCPA